jgi:hypothetical protein
VAQEQRNPERTLVPFDGGRLVVASPDLKGLPVYLGSDPLANEVSLDGAALSRAIMRPQNY